ncbi:DapH/DapD/GlmU-related protein [Pseudomonas canadensis]|uniref:DapH/DapD/GlmU-related protein n=1 Tax=Pseudomonas canadensis TaxID=915099 RepID=A0ABZ1ABD5_9PSED|nr:DapH/DapD/GlmU-related protein [Pseudomonas canadensis]WRI26432.1 DapH/DapD/GlmU-related protein [Pseudomonas canadensis]
MSYFFKKLKQHHVFIVPMVIGQFLFVWRAFIHLRALPAPGKRAYLGRAPKVFGLEHITLGNNFRVGEGLWLHAVSQYLKFMYQPQVDVGENFSASDHLHIACCNRITIGRNVLMGSKIHITDHSHGDYSGENQSSPYETPFERKLASSGPVTIGDNVWIGDNVVVLPNTSIGDGAIIGANSVVAKDIPSNVIAVGCPARVVKVWSDKESKWLNV